MFEWMHMQPEESSVFSKTTTISNATRSDNLGATISELFPVRDEEVDASKTVEVQEQVLLVDVDGRRGKIVEEVWRRRPDLKGRLIMQELL